MQQLSLRDNVQAGIYRVINPAVGLLIRAGLTPNAVTTIGMLLNGGVAVVFIVGAEAGHRGDLRFVGWGGALILFAGLFDMLDGQVARLGNMKSTFGALYDSVLDRYSELFTFLGICHYLVAHHYFLSSLFAFVALIGSMMVSYTRARAEGLGIQCKGGLMQRPERVVLLGVSALLCGVAANTVIYQLNLNAQGRVNRREPVQVFWMRYAEDGQPRALNFIQRRFAYGLHAKQVESDAYELRFVSYAKFPLYLDRSAGDNQYRVYATIGRRRAVLQRIFLHIEGGSFWAPNVQYVELKGTDAATGAEIVERIKV
jgi:phosphatidylglycerophosphate synthase